MKNQNSEILSVLAECAAACNNCFSQCLSEKDVKMMAECIRLDIDCAQICHVTAAFIARNSDHAKHLMSECAEICKKCADECAKHDNAHCKECAEACQKCAKACSTSIEVFN